MLLFLISLSGLLSALRISLHFRARALLAETVVTKTGTTTCLSILASVFSMRDAPVHALILVIACAFASYLLLFAVERSERAKLVLEARLFLDRWLLNIHLGYSLSSARTAALTASTARLRKLVEPLFLSPGSAPRTHLIFATAALRELATLEQNGPSPSERLAALRDMIKKADDFRRKSGQASRQAHLQALVLLVLHIALLIFTLKRYGWRPHSDLILLSVALCISGLVFMRFLARKTRWTI